MNKKLEKRDYLYISILIIFIIGMVFILTRTKYIYGSTLDWKDQHYLFADYFRSMFYNSGNLIPEFAFNIGGGQNIFNFAYYGLLNPIILISYLFPFIDMMYYIIISSILIVIISVILFYKWLKNNDVSSNLCFLVSFIFAASAPLLFHSHRHIMFINYMPFLILGLMGIDKYFQDKKFFLITFSTMLMIFTSYYFSVPGIIVLGIYFIYKYLSLNKEFNLKDFCLYLIKFIYFIILAILIAAVLLLPVFSTILSGRSTTILNFNILPLFIPKFNIGYILYNSYGLGLTSILIIALINMLFHKDKSNKFLSVCLILIFCIPIFLYLLNGTLYVNAKVLIPFLPLACFIIAKGLKEIFNHNIYIKRIVIFSVILGIVSIFMNDKGMFIIFIVDLLIVLTSIILYNYKNKKVLLVFPLIIISLLNCLINNFNDKLYLKSDHQKYYNPDIEENIKKILENDKSIYRINNNLNPLATSNKVYDPHYYQSSLYSSTYNGNYKNFYVNVFQNEIPYRNSVINGETSNLLYQIYMGEKYIITKKAPNMGYKLISDNKDFQVYKNENYLPIGYATDKILNYDFYKTLEYPYNTLALLDYVIVNENINNKYVSNIETYDVSSLELLNSKLKTVKRDNAYYFKNNEEVSISVPLKNKLHNKVLFISFDMNLSQSCSKGDTYITINGIKNKLTCKSWKYHNNNYTFNYVISNPDIKKLNIKFSEGEFLINNIKAYTLDYDNIVNLKSNIDELNIDYDKTKDNKIMGNINVRKDGYLILKIPYDKGFEIYIDGVKKSLENVNEGFIGTSITKGSHDVKLIYHTPLLKLGKIVSLVGIFLFVISLIISKCWQKLKEL